MYKNCSFRNVMWNYLLFNYYAYITAFLLLTADNIKQINSCGRNTGSAQQLQSWTAYQVVVMNAQELTWVQQNLSIRIWRLTGSDASDVFCDFSHENNHNPTISVQNLVQIPYNCHRVSGSQDISNAGCKFTCVTFLSMKMTTRYVILRFLGCSLARP